MFLLAQPLQIHGSGFTANTEVFVYTLTRAATFVDSTRLDIMPAQSDLTDAGALDVQVFNSAVSPACVIQRDATLPVLSRPNEIFGDAFE